MTRRIAGTIFRLARLAALGRPPHPSAPTHSPCTVVHPPAWGLQRADVGNQQLECTTDRGAAASLGELPDPIPPAGFRGVEVGVQHPDQVFAPRSVIARGLARNGVVGRKRGIGHRPPEIQVFLAGCMGDRDEALEDRCRCAFWFPSERKPFLHGLHGRTQAPTCGGDHATQWLRHSVGTRSDEVADLGQALQVAVSHEVRSQGPKCQRGCGRVAMQWRGVTRRGLCGIAGALWECALTVAPCEQMDCWLIHDDSPIELWASVLARVAMSQSCTQVLPRADSRPAVLWRPGTTARFGSGWRCPRPNSVTSGGTVAKCAGTPTALWRCGVPCDDGAMRRARFGMVELSEGELRLAEAFLGWQGTALTDAEDLAGALAASRDQLAAQGDVGELLLAFVADMVREAEGPDSTDTPTPEAPK